MVNIFTDRKLGAFKRRHRTLLQGVEKPLKIEATEHQFWEKFYMNENNSQKSQKLRKSYEKLILSRVQEPNSG